MNIKNITAILILQILPIVSIAQNLKGNECDANHVANNCKPEYMSGQGIQHPWKNKRVAFFGDSLTDPKNNGSKKKYWGFLAEWLGIDTYVYGVSGRQWNDIPRQASKLKEEHGADFDAIMIFIGTNDFNAAIPIGEWFHYGTEEVTAAVHAPKAVVKRMARTPVMSDSTYRGRINIALSTIKSMFPEKQIILITPIHRAYAEFSDNNIQPSERYTNACGEYVDAYVNSVKEAGNIWAMPVIDLNSVSGLFPLMEEHVRYFHDAETDMLHPNDAGQERLAKCLYWQLLTLPTF